MAIATMYLTLTWAGRGQFCVSRFVKKFDKTDFRTKSVKPKIIFNIQFNNLFYYSINGHV